MNRMHAMQQHGMELVTLKYEIVYCVVYQVDRIIDNM